MSGLRWKLWGKRYGYREIADLPGYGVMRGEFPAFWFQGNGVTMWLDSIWLLRISYEGRLVFPWLERVCLIVPSFWHDWPYAREGTKHDRLRADLNYWINCRRVGLDTRPAWGEFWQRLDLHLRNIQATLHNNLMYYRLRFWGHFYFRYARSEDMERWSPKWWACAARNLVMRYFEQ